MDWSYTTKEGDVFTCERVAEKTKRCTIRFSDDGVRADEACKKTCGTCPEALHPRTVKRYV